MQRDRLLIINTYSLNSKNNDSNKNLGCEKILFDGLSALITTSKSFILEDLLDRLIHFSNSSIPLNNSLNKKIIKDYFKEKLSYLNYVSIKLAKSEDKLLLIIQHLIVNIDFKKITTLPFKDTMDSFVILSTFQDILSKDFHLHCKTYLNNPHLTKSQYIDMLNKSLESSPSNLDKVEEIKARHKIHVDKVRLNLDSKLYKKSKAPIKFNTKVAWPKKDNEAIDKTERQGNSLLSCFKKN